MPATKHCEYVKKCAKGLNIELEFLPGYSPNLNVIERLWKYLKKILGKQYHGCKDSFEKSIVKLLESLGDDIHQEKLWTLLNPIFQRYEKITNLGLLNYKNDSNAFVCFLKCDIY
jgi:transposase